MNIRRYRRVFAGSVIAALVLHASPASPATIPVSGSCTLTAAIQAANNDDDSGGVCPPGGSGADTLELSGDVLLTTAVDGDENGLPIVTSEITVAGNGFTIERDPAAEPFRILSVDPTGTLTLNDVTLRNGLTTGSGGGILSRGTTLLDNSHVTENMAFYGGGIRNDSGFLGLTSSTVTGNEGVIVGGIYNRASTAEATATLVDSVVSDNNGTGISSIGYAFDADLSLTDTSVRGNVGGGVGLAGSMTMLRGDVSENAEDGIWHSADSTTNRLVALTNVTIANNQGAGVRTKYYTLTEITGCTIVGNEASGVYARNAYVPITNSTISGNRNTRGAGIFDYDASIVIENSTITGNVATEFGGGVLQGYVGDMDGPVINNSIVAGNAPDDCFASILGRQNNFGTCFMASPITPGLDFDTALADNGGDTLTHALLPGSVAANAAGACGLDTDQRGVPRSDGACDSGSFELQPRGACCIAPNSQRICVEDQTREACESERGIFGGDGTDCADPLACELLLVTMDSMQAHATDSGVVLRWVTATEIDTVGFRVLREGSRREKALQLVAHVAASGSELGGQSYELLDDAPAAFRAARYYIEDVDVFGRVNRHGPIAVQRERDPGDTNRVLGRHDPLRRE